jgi:hypothetical protein
MIRSNHYSRWLNTGLFLLLCSLAPVAAADKSERESLPRELKVISLEVFPEKVELNNPFAYRQLIMTGMLKTGESVDLTRMVTLESNPSSVTVSENGLVRPLENGSEQLQVQGPVACDGLQPGGLPAGEFCPGRAAVAFQAGL